MLGNCGIFGGSNDGILFFILVFLILFSGGCSGCNPGCQCEKECC